MEKFLTEDEFNEFKALKKQYDNIIYSLGEIELEIMELQNQKNNIQDGISILKTQDKALGTKLENKYGPIIIDITTGEIKPMEKE